MMQCVNHLQNNIFVNLAHYLYYLMQLGLMVGWQEMQVNFEIFKVGCRLKIFDLSLCLTNARQ